MSKFSKRFVRKMMDNFDVNVLGNDALVAMDEYTTYLIEVFFGIIMVTNTEEYVESMFESEAEVEAFLGVA